MAQAETDIVHTIMKDASLHGARLFKNVRGLFFTLDSVRALCDAAKSMNPKRVVDAIRNLRQVRAGLQADGSSDLIGFRPLLITQEMVGLTLPIFTNIEVKTATGALKEKQPEWLNFVLKNGGFSGVARSPEDAKKIMNYPLD